MKTSTAWILIGLSALAVAQQRLVFKDSRKNPKILIEGNRGLVVPDSKFELTGKVVVKNFADKLTMNCEKVTGDLVREKQKDKEVSTFDNVRLTGGVKVVIGDEPTVVKMSANSASYDLQPSNQALIKLTGSANFSFLGSNEDGEKSDLLVTAPNVQTVMTREKDIKNPVISAKLWGGVVFNGYELKNKKDAKTGKIDLISQKVQIKANEATYEKVGTSKGPEITLNGDLIFLQNPGDDDGAEVTGAQSAVLELDSENRVKLIRFSAGQQGSKRTPITTVIKKKKGAQA